MRISFVMLGLRDHSTGGYVFNDHMARALEEAGHLVDVIHFRTIPVRSRGSRLRGSFHVLRRVLKHRPDLLIVSKSYSFMAPLRFLLPFMRCPVLYLVHHLEWHDRKGGVSPARRRMVRWLLSSADRIWVNSACTAEDVSGLGLDRGLMEIIPPGLDRFPVPDRSEPAAPVRIISVGTLCPRKDQMTLVRSCWKIRELDFCLEILGDEDADASYALAVRNEVSRLGLDHRVRFRGHLSREELERSYGESHLLANLSLWEGYGMAAAEALWAGLPVVAADAGAVPELVTDGVEGFLVPPADADECAARLRSLINDSKLRETMSRRARERGSQLYTWRDSADHFIRLAESMAPDKET